MTVKDVAEKITSMEIRGALDIGLAAASALLEEVEAGKSFREVEASGEILKNARPTAVSLPNAVEYCLFALNQSKDNSIAAKTIQDFIKLQEDSVEKIGRYGSRLIKNGDIILTHCNSDTVVKVFEYAKNAGKKFEVYATETRPRNQGYLTAKAVRNLGIPVTLIPDSAVNYCMKEKNVDMVMVGADTVYTNGDVVNKIGTSQVALIANAEEVDFNVATGTIKFSPQSLYGVGVEIEERDPKELVEIEGVNVFNPAFDVVPKEHVTRIITEDGVIPPEAAYNIVKEKFGWRAGK
ncbi:MAG TPA: ribose 1,5-bisphosphate isomerase [Candidatus Altiarchaeales archaeon]|nr:ribose 1,5-bisphosphate isomerase [Candidatus Altiarchaeales archaeon]